MPLDRPRRGRRWAPPGGLQPREAHPPGLAYRRTAALVARPSLDWVLCHAPAHVAHETFDVTLGAGVHQLEQEVKLEPNPGWSLPTLGRHLARCPGPAAGRCGARDHLLRHRRPAPGPTPPDPPVPPPDGDRPGSRRLEDRRTTEVWTVKLPASSSDNTVLARTEVTWEGDAAGSSPGGRRAAGRRRATGRALQNRDYEFEKVLPEAAHFVQAVALGRLLEPVAHLSSIRRRTELRTSDGRPLAEIDEDTITGRDLLATQERLSRHGEAPDVRFREVEVELAEGSALEVLDRGGRDAGGGGSAPQPRQEQIGEGTGRRLFRSGPGGLAAVRAPDTRAQEVAMSDVLQEQARSCLNTLMDHDPAIRLDDPDPEHIHRSRVATPTLSHDLAGVRSIGDLRSGGPGGLRAR